MIKRVIFDLDNTLMDWKDEYLDAVIENVFKYHKVPNSKEDTKKAIVKAVAYHQEKALKMDRKELNSNLKENMPESFVDLCIKYECDMVPDQIDKELIDTLEYLRKKYDMAILTNWFEETQVERLKKADLYKYFNEVYAGEYMLKPNKDSYIRAAGKYRMEECVMIGDSIKQDVYGPIKYGMNAIYYNPCGKGIPDKEPKYKVVQKISELKDIL